MDKVLQAATDTERKLGKLNVIMAKGTEILTANDLIKQARKGNSIKLTIKKGIKSSETANPIEAEMKELLVILTRIVTLEEKQMGFAVDSKPQFEKLHCAGMVKKSLEKSEGTGSCVDFAKILAEKHMPGFKPEVDDLFRREVESVKKTLAAYSNATGGEDQIDDKADDSE